MTRRADKQHRLQALIAVKFRHLGYTNKQIAEQLAINVKTIPALISLGARMAPFEDENSV